jgi:hypothetical protein
LRSRHGANPLPDVNIRASHAWTYLLSLRFSLALTPMNVDYFGMLFRLVFWIVENAAQGNPPRVRP